MDTTDGSIKLISDVIKSLINIDMSVLMGANIALDVAKEDFCESTIGCRSPEQGEVLKALFQRPSFRISVVRDVAAVELCGALKVGVVREEG
jgi:glycerol-3-phosphate dehydrogenase (NAD+)